MKIVGLEIFSSYTGEWWTLEQDNSPAFADGFDDSCVGHFHWKRCLKDQISPQGIDRTSLGLAAMENSIYKELDRRISRWRGDMATDVITLELDRLQLSIMNSVRDILFEFLSSLLSGNGRIGGVTGYYITCQHDLPLYDWCLKLCKGSNFGRVCTLDLSMYLSQLDYLNLCYINRCFTAICSCFDCCSVYNKLSESHQDILSNELLINLITGEKRRLKRFIQHNNRRSTLELILLEITLDIYQFYESRQEFGYFGTKKSLPSSFFDNCCSFVILKGIDIFNDLCNNQKIPLNIGSLVVDLFEDYVEIWDKLNLPVFIFLTSSNNRPSPSKGIILDDDFHMKLHNDQAVNISNLSFVKYKFNLNNATLVDENLKYQTLLNASRELTETDDLALPLMKLSRGYTLDDVKLLLRFTKCELMRNANMSCGAAISHENILECYEQSTTTIKPINLTTHMPMTCTIHTSAKYINNRDIVPLEVKGGQVRRIHGFKSMILEDDIIEQLNNFFNAETIDSSIGLIIQGPHGSGKSLLAAAIAYELNCTLISANMLDFVKPQVGLSEKLIHGFFSSIKHQFNDIQIGKKNRRERVRCVVVLEGLESLTEEVSYIRRIFHSLYMELDVFSARSTWLSDNSVLFITTVDNIASIPQGLIKCDKFGEVITLRDELKDREGIEECLKLYLNGRCDDFESLGVIANELIICGINRASTVALFCKEAIIYAQHAAGPQKVTPLHIRNFLEYYKQKTHKLNNK